MSVSHSISVGTAPKRRERVGVERPHRLGHRRAVIVDQDDLPVGVVHRVTGQVDLAHRSAGSASR